MKYAAILLVVLLCSLCARPRLSAQPNTVFIIADDLGWADVLSAGWLCTLEGPELGRRESHRATARRKISSGAPDLHSGRRLEVDVPPIGRLEVGGQRGFQKGTL